MIYAMFYADSISEQVYMRFECQKARGALRVDPAFPLTCVNRAVNWQFRVYITMKGLPNLIQAMQLMKEVESGKSL